MNLQQNVLLKNLGSYKIGGSAKYFADVNSLEDLNSFNISEFGKFFVLGGGTNLLIADEGFEGIVLQNKILGIDLNDEFIHIGAGVEVKDFLDFCVENSISGLEWAGGLPGTVGGAVRGNAGAFGGEIKNSVYEIESFDLSTKQIRRRKKEECNFGYRWSVYKENLNEIITKVTLKLNRGDKDLIRQQIQEKVDYRNLKHPMEYPNIGSTFKNIPLEKVGQAQKEEFKDFIKNDPFPVVLTTKLLALAGLKGERSGDAQISEKHPNFIVNLGNAKASDVRKLIEFAKKTVKDKWGIELEEEITYLE